MKLTLILLHSNADLCVHRACTAPRELQFFCMNLLFPLKTLFLFSVPIILLYRVRRAELRRASWMWIQRPRP